MSGSYACIPEAAYMQLVGGRMGKKDTALQISGSVLSSLIAASDLRGTKRQAATVMSPLMWQAPPLLAEVTTPGDIKNWCLSLLHFNLFSPFGSQTLKIRIFKSTAHIGEIKESHYVCPGKGIGSDNLRKP